MNKEVAEVFKRLDLFNLDIKKNIEDIYNRLYITFDDNEISYLLDYIENLKQENNQLKKDLSEQLKLTNEENLQCSKYAIEINHLKEQRQELRSWLEEMLDDEKDIFSVVRVKDVLSKLNELEWCTRKYNIKHAYEKGLNPTKKQIIEYVSKLEDRIEKLEKVIKSMEYRLGE